MWFKLILADMCILQAQRIVPKVYFLEYSIPKILGDSKKNQFWIGNCQKLLGRVSATRQSLDGGGGGGGGGG